MVNDFDKEIDAMLRDLAKGDTFAQVLPKKHLDADEISAFAENALPQMARVRVTEHLADCSKCRKILATTVSLNSAEESEIIHEEVKTVISAPAIPWYKSLFAFPNLAYTMGAMALLLVGMVGFLVLQNSNNSEPMVAQSEKAADKSSGPNLGTSEGDAYASNSYSAANSTANAPAAMATPAPNSNAAASNAPISKDSMPVSPTSAANSNASALKTSEQDLTASKSGKVADDAVEDKKSDAPTDLAKKENAKPVATPAAEETVNEKGGERRDLGKQSEVSQTQNVQNVSPDSRNIPRNQTYTPPPSTASGAAQETQDRERSAPQKSKKMANKDADEAKNRSNEVLKIGDKSFRKTNGVWTDTSYSGGSTQNVKRGSDDYKKLDSGLQNIGNAFNGTVIIVWAGKNYKIQ